MRFLRLIVATLLLLGAARWRHYLDQQLASSEADCMLGWVLSVLIPLLALLLIVEALTLYLGEHPLLWLWKRNEVKKGCAQAKQAETHKTQAL